MSELRETLVGDDDVEIARKQFERAMEWESTSRKKFLDDLKFANADSFNGFQWPDEIRRTRDLQDRPCLTINMVRQHNNMISNEARKNKSSVKIVGMGNGATQESANCVKDLIRHIEYISNAQSAYTCARGFQVDGGIGWWRIVTDYESEDSFDQEIYIMRVADPLSVLMDPDIQTLTGEDAKFAFLFDFLPDEEVRNIVPEGVEIPKMPMRLTTGESFFIEKDHTMVCEWFRKKPKEDKLLSFMNDPTGVRTVVRASSLPKETAKSLSEKKSTMVRRIVENEVEWNLIVGNQIVDTISWPGKYIPLIRVIGEEYVIGGELDRKGHTRGMQDGQRMYNYNASGQVEFGALQSKTPWLAPAKAIEEHESMWNTANTENHSVLIYNHLDDAVDAQIAPIPAPQRLEPPAASGLFESGMQTSFNQMMMASGQWQNQMGMMGNERTGTAIRERQDQGDTATFHFQDNYGEALRFTYVQLIDLFPKIYDTRRIKHIMADDGTDMEVLLDPGARVAYGQTLNHNNEIIARVLNPQLGKYQVAADVGPATATKRQETVDAMSLILTQAPGLTGIIGDILLRALDFDESQEAALRLKRMVPPQALGQGPTPQEQQLQQQVQQLQMTLAEALQRHGKDALKLVGKDQMRDIDVYKAETDRIKALAPMLPTDEEGLKAMIEQLVGDAMKTHLLPIIQQNIEGLQDQSSGEGSSGEGDSPEDEEPPVHGASKAPDGNWYVLDPTRRSRYLRIAPLAQEK